MTKLYRIAGKFLMVQSFTEMPPDLKFSQFFCEERKHNALTTCTTTCRLPPLTQHSLTPMFCESW